MAEPNIAQRTPYIVELQPGDYWWCQCGKSKKQPLCDSSHKGGEFKPVKFTVTEKKLYELCACKHTNNKPFCDKTHKTL